VQDDKRRIVHLLFFVATNFSAFDPIIHTETIFPYAKLDKQVGFRFNYMEDVPSLTVCVYGLLITGSLIKTRILPGAIRSTLVTQC
jgi:hypothetical protein